MALLVAFSPWRETVFSSYTWISLTFSIVKNTCGQRGCQGVVLLGLRTSRGPPARCESRPPQHRVVPAGAAMFWLAPDPPTSHICSWKTLLSLSMSSPPSEPSVLISPDCLLLSRRSFSSFTLQEEEGEGDEGGERETERKKGRNINREKERKQEEERMKEKI